MTTRPSKPSRPLPPTISERLARTAARPRGFAAMPPHRQREIASAGGLAVSRNSRYMARIGRKGGQAKRGAEGGK